MCIHAWLRLYRTALHACVFVHAISLLVSLFLSPSCFLSFFLTYSLLVLTNHVWGGRGDWVESRGARGGEKRARTSRARKAVQTCGRVAVLAVCVGIERAGERARRACAEWWLTTGAVDGRTDGRTVGRSVVRSFGRSVGWRSDRDCVEERRKKEEEEVQNLQCTVLVAVWKKIVRFCVGFSSSSIWKERLSSSPSYLRGLARAYADQCTEGFPIFSPVYFSFLSFSFSDHQVHWLEDARGRVEI